MKPQTRENRQRHETNVTNSPGAQTADAALLAVIRRMNHNDEDTADADGVALMEAAAERARARRARAR
jgi:hypothetical protein